MSTDESDNERFKGMITSKSVNCIYWCPDDYDDGITVICDALYFCENELSKNVCSLIATFVIGDKWPINVLVKSTGTSYETISVNPNEKGQAIYRECNKRHINHFGGQGMVLLNRNNARKLIRYKTLLEQNIDNGTKFEPTAAFRGKGRLYNMW